MAKYTGSPFGSIHGKIGHVVGFVYKGINVIRKDFTPAFSNTIKQQAVKNIFPILQKLASRHFVNITKAIWERLLERSYKPWTGINLFTHKSGRVLWKSTNNGIQDPDYGLMFVSDGILEPARQLLAPDYDPSTGLVTLTWNVDTFRNGSSSDSAHILVFQKPVSATPTTPAIPFGNSWLVDTGVPRGAGLASANIPSNLDAFDLTVFLYFNDDTCTYSPSISRGVTQKRDTVFSEYEALITNSSTYEKVETFKILRCLWHRTYRIFGYISNCSLFFRVKSIIDGDLDSNVHTQSGTSATIEVPRRAVSSQQEYIDVEVYAKKEGTANARIEYMLFYAYGA